MLISEYCDPREQLEMPRMSCVYLNTPLMSVGDFALSILFVIMSDQPSKQ